MNHQTRRALQSAAQALQYAQQRQTVLDAIQEVQDALQAPPDVSELPAIRLTRIGTECVVAIELPGRWVPIIRDSGDTISHVVEPSGIRAAIDNGGAAPDPSWPIDVERIVAIRDELLPSQGEGFDCIAFALAVLEAARASRPINDRRASVSALRKSMSSDRDLLTAELVDMVASDLESLHARSPRRTASSTSGAAERATRRTRSTRPHIGSTRHCAPRCALASTSPK